MPVLQRHQHADHAMQRCQRVADADAHTHRHTAWLAGQVAQPAHGFGDHSKTGAVAVRAGLAIAADAQHDQARIEFQQIARPQPPALHRAGPKIFNQYIGIQRQLANNLLRLKLF